jgi:hypothetical protein
LLKQGNVIKRDKIQNLSADKYIMKIKSINLSKSKTIGVISGDGRTKFKKLQISVQADLSESDIPDGVYLELSQFIENQFLLESKIK